MKLYGFLYLTIVFTLDSGDCKCDEYIIVLKEVSCAGTHSLNTTKLFDIKWNELTYPYNSTGMYHEIYGYKGCVLELDCENQSSECTKRKKDTEGPIINKNDTDEIKIEDKPIFDVNIIYLNKDKVKLSKSQTKIVPYCDYAETECVKKNKVLSSSTNNAKDNFHRTSYKGTLKELELTLKRDQNSTLPQIFMGFVSPNVSADTKYEHLEATYKCKFKENHRCEINSAIHENKGKSAIKEILDEPNNSINVYMYSEYIENNTKIKYTGCKKNSDDIGDLFKIQCEANNFTTDHPLVLYTQDTDYITTTSKPNESVNVYCLSRKLNETNKLKLQKGNAQIGFNIIYFNSCHSSLNNSGITEHHKRNITLILENKKEYIDSTTKKNDVVTTTSAIEKSSSSIINKVNITATKENILKMHITTDSLNNCSQYPLNYVTEGKVIDFRTNNIEKEVSTYGSVELKLLSCINSTSYPENNTNENKTYEQQTKLIILLNNGSHSKQINEDPDVVKDSTVIILQCDINSDTNKAKKAFKCDAMDLSDYKDTNVDSTKKLQINAKEKKGNQTIEFKTKKYNCSSNATEIDVCVSKNCNTTEFNRCNNASSINETDNDSTGADKEGLVIKSHDSERIILIVIASIASFSMVLVWAIKKIAYVGEYTPAATREPPDEEDTPF